MTHLNVCTGLLKGTSEWGLTHWTIIAKPISSLDRAAYACCWRRSVESLTLRKQPCMYQYVDATLESMWLSVPRVTAATKVSCHLGSRCTEMTHIPSPTSTIGKNVSQSWSPSENIPYQRSVARLLVMIVPETYRREDLDTICPPWVFHSSELEFMSSQTLKRTYALYAPTGE